jgi:hypothetical protein
MTARLRTWLIGAALIVVGVIVGYALPQNSVAPKSEAGTVLSVKGHLGNPTASLRFKPTGATGPVTYPLDSPTPWQPKSGATWNTSGTPACLTPGSKVTLGVINVDGVGSAPSGERIIWVECFTT